MPTDDVLSIFGLGKLGCSMLACFAHKGWSVIGVDSRREPVDAIRAGTSPVYEPGVEPLIQAHRDRISVTTDAVPAVLKSDVSFIIVPTPSNDDGSFTTVYVEEVIAEIGSILRSKDRRHLVVVTSTVLPGDMQHMVEFLEKTSGKLCARDFGVCYNPDFIALGSVVRDFLNPDLVLIGESDAEAGSRLQAIHEALVENRPSIHRMNFSNAELAKIALNAYCTQKITFANSIAEICERLPGGDAAVVTRALGSDSRIGSKYFRGGLSYGGPCFPRDNRALSSSARRVGCNTPQSDLTDRLNTYIRNERIPDILFELLRQRGLQTLSVLGLTYKADTPIVEESASIHIIRALTRRGIRIRAYDPAGMDEARRVLGLDAITFSPTLQDCLSGSRAVFVATPWPAFRQLQPDDFVRHMGGRPLVYDGCGLYEFVTPGPVDLISIGKYAETREIRRHT